MIALNILVHVVRHFLPEVQDEAAVSLLAFDTSAPLTAPTLLSLVTYQFLHADWLHLGVNMMSLLAFGSGLERMLPGYRFLAFYLIGGIVAALFESVTSTAIDAEVLVGASGSISAIFGAVIILLGLNRQGQRPISLPLMVVLIVLPMVVMGSLGIGGDGLPIAWRAHVGGFGFGLLFGLVVRAIYRRRS